MKLDYRRVRYERSETQIGTGRLIGVSNLGTFVRRIYSSEW